MDILLQFVGGMSTASDNFADAPRLEHHQCDFDHAADQYEERVEIDISVLDTPAVQGHIPSFPTVVALDA